MEIQPERCTIWTRRWTASAVWTSLSWEWAWRTMLTLLKYTRLCPVRPSSTTSVCPTSPSSSALWWESRRTLVWSLRHLQLQLLQRPQRPPVSIWSKYAEELLWWGNTGNVDGAPLCLWLHCCPTVIVSSDLESWFRPLPLVSLYYYQESVISCLLLSSSRWNLFIFHLSVVVVVVKSILVWWAVICSSSMANDK